VQVLQLQSQIASGLFDGGGHQFLLKNMLRLFIEGRHVVQIVQKVTTIAGSHVQVD